MYKIKNFEFSKDSSSNTDIIDITNDIFKKVQEAEVQNGSVLIYIQGSTASLTTIEYESGVLDDFKKALERLVPENMVYKHDLKWGDGNGYSHIRSSLLGPSVTIPIVSGELMVGTWQQIVLLDFDNRPRKRKIIVQVSGI